MGINLCVSFAFKPRRKLSDKTLDKLAEALGPYSEVGMNDDGEVYAQGSDIGGDGDDAVRAFIEKYAPNYVVVKGDCDEGEFEEIICPPHVVQWRAEVDWRQKEIHRMTREIVDITIAAHIPPKGKS